MFNDPNASDPTHSVLSKVRLVFMFDAHDANPHKGPLRYHFERAGRQGCKGCRRALRKTHRRGLSHKQTTSWSSILNSIEGLVEQLKSRRCHQQGT